MTRLWFKSLHTSYMPCYIKHCLKLKFILELWSWQYPWLRWRSTKTDPRDNRSKIRVRFSHKTIWGLQQIYHDVSPQRFYGELGYYSLFNIVADVFIAGQDTTSSSILWTFLYLLHHPKAQAKVHEELDEVNNPIWRKTYTTELFQILLRPGSWKRCSSNHDAQREVALP